MATRLALGVGSLRMVSASDVLLDLRISGSSSSSSSSSDLSNSLLYLSSSLLSPSLLSSSLLSSSCKPSSMSSTPVSTDSNKESPTVPPSRKARPTLSILSVDHGVR